MEEITKIFQVGELVIRKSEIEKPTCPEAFEVQDVRADEVLINDVWRKSEQYLPIKDGLQKADQYHIALEERLRIEKEELEKKFLENARVIGCIGAKLMGIRAREGKK